MNLKNFNLLKNVRCSEEIWEINGITLEKYKQENLFYFKYQ